MTTLTTYSITSVAISAFSRLEIVSYTDTDCCLTYTIPTTATYLYYTWHIAPALLPFCTAIFHNIILWPFIHCPHGTHFSCYSCTNISYLHYIYNYISSLILTATLLLPCCYLPLLKHLAIFHHFPPRLHLELPASLATKY